MPTPVSHRVQKRRNAMRAAGLRPVQIWVPTPAAPALQPSAAVRTCSSQSPTVPTPLWVISWTLPWSMWTAGIKAGRSGRGRRSGRSQRSQRSRQTAARSGDPVRSFFLTLPSQPFCWSRLRSTTRPWSG